MRNIATLVALLLFGLLMSMAIPPLDAARGIAQYLPLHSLLETIAIVVAMMIFAISWNTYSKKLPANILLLGSVFLGVAMLDSEKIVRD